jgi:hypothetical protein
MASPGKKLGMETLETRLNLSGLNSLQQPGATAAAGAQVIVQAKSAAAPIALNAGAVTSDANLWGQPAQAVSDTSAAPLRRNRPMRELAKDVYVPPAPAPAVTLSFTPTQLAAPNPAPAAPQSLVFSPTDPLASLLAQLHGDNVHDDYPVLQKMVDTAYADNIKTITLPAGTYLLNHEINLYGSGVTLTGQGSSTILDVNNSYTGVPGTAQGRAITVTPVFSPTLDMISQPVTGNTIVFTGQVNLQAGDTVYLTDGRGSIALIEQRDGGADTGPGAFKELGSDEYVTIASVTTDAQGETVATLTKNVAGIGEYFNVAPQGAAPSEAYLHVSQILKPADHITIQNLAIRFKTPKADTSIFSSYSNYLTIQNVDILNTPEVGGMGSIGIVGSMNTVIENVTAPSNVTIGLNSSRFALVTDCSVGNIELEEGVTDSIIQNNTLTTTTTCALRVNDMACARDSFVGNTMNGGVADTGAIAIAEGTDITLAYNRIIPRNVGGDGIWFGISSGGYAYGNTGAGLSAFNPLTPLELFDNNWQ